MAKITLSLWILGILLGGFLAFGTAAPPDYDDLESEIEFCSLAAALHDVKTTLEQQQSHDFAFRCRIPQAVSDRITLSAYAIGLIVGRKTAEGELNGNSAEIPFGRLINIPIPGLSDIVPEWVHHQYTNGTSKLVQKQIRTRIERACQHGFRLGILDAVDTAVLNEAKRLPSDMVLSDVHRLRLLWVQQWSETEKEQAIRPSPCAP